jgi:tetratricopeptide (TPR) repeat protein
MQADDEGDYGLAMERYAEALVLHRAIGNRNSEGGTLNNLGYAAMSLGDYETAIERFCEARALFAAVGNRQNEAVTWINAGIAELNLGRPEVALDAIDKALPILRAAGARWLEAAALRLQGQSELALGRFQIAGTHLLGSRNQFRALNMTQFALEPSAALAQVALLSGDSAAALNEVESILDAQAQGMSLDGTEEPMRVALICHQVLAECRDPRASMVLGQAHESLMSRAHRISDEARRRSFLERVPYHRQIVRAWASTMGLAPN